MDQSTPADEAGTKPWTWVLPDGHASNDWAHFCTRFEAVVARRRFELITLGSASGEPLLMLRCGTANPSAPQLLVTSGFHGEEPAGPWGVLEFLETAEQALLSRVQLAVLPLINVTGFRAGTRFNALGENPNRGYLDLGGENPSIEGRLLLSHRDLLRQSARDGLLTCHEDVLLSHGYVYGNERAAVPGEFSRALLAVNAAFFPVHPDGAVDGCPIAGGIVFNHHDSSFESWMMEQGAARAACVETPGQHPIARRIAAQRAMIETFLDCGPQAGG
jgi:hypothetical protein